MHWTLSFWNTLSGRFTALTVALFAVLQLVQFGFFQYSVQHNAKIQTQERFELGERLFTSLLLQRKDTLEQSAKILAADFGLRSAFLSKDIPTIQSALDNHSERINAPLALYLDLNYKPLATGSEPLHENIDFAQLDYLLKHQQQLLILNNIPYQIVSVPLKAPTTVGYIVMGFEINDQMLHRFKTLSNIELLIVSQHTDPSITNIELSSTHIPTLTAPSSLPEQISLQEPSTFKYNDELIFTNSYALNSDTSLTVKPKQVGKQTYVVMIASLNQSLALFTPLQMTLLAISILGGLLFSFLSIKGAQRIISPLNTLLQSSQRISRGNLHTPIELSTNLKELSNLSDSFEQMRQSVFKAQEHIRDLAYNDALTKLPNRAAFFQFIQSACLQYHQTPSDTAKPIGVLVFDLQRFKHINDALGYNCADELLIQIGQQLISFSCKYDTHYARLSADEFAILFTTISEEQFPQFIQDFCAHIERPHFIMNVAVDVLICSGYSFYPTFANSAQQVLAQAQMAMYEAKRLRQTTLCYNSQMDSSSEQTISLLGELRTAIAQNQLRLFVQPKMNLKNKRIDALELLVRWQHPERGLVPPLQFIPFAEQTGFIRHLTQWVFKTAVQVQQDLIHRGIHLTLSLNLSTQDLLDPTLIPQFNIILSESGADAHTFCLEITESAVMDDPQKALEILTQLRTMGFSLSIDDFGTGYSSLSYLKSLPVQELKIDKSFVLNMDKNQNDSIIVRSTIDLAHNLGLTVTAEGIENETILEQLNVLGCDTAQGYHIAKPMPIDVFFPWFLKYTSPL